ncbi:WecB/TagA/CpsF family glycosyltransferase [Cryobacterium sp. M96]|uniref:WecB/TagA/CpsF family glycosyltransferase n=1 Tax=Cryobacterium sp. M96 TaxID=2048295 RepID=UPI000CE545DE|nr:WecB/TagA/CpsF family glycosyltransferase [Cryobacterium sp. M96]
MNTNTNPQAEALPVGLIRAVRHRVGSVDFVSASPETAVEQVIALALLGQGHHVHLANAYTVALADKSAEYRVLLAEPAINYPDGKPIGWVSVLRRQSPRLEQVRGPQLFLDVFQEGITANVRHYLLGSTPGVLALLKENLTSRFPGVAIVGVESPPFRSMSKREIDEQDERIRVSGAQIVWVGLGTPKQDIEVVRLSSVLPVTAVAIGAAFDFAAGTQKEAPPWMRSSGLEWAYRLGSEPRRLWKRYVFGNARFLKAALIAPRR